MAVDRSGEDVVRLAAMKRRKFLMGFQEEKVMAVTLWVAAG